MLVLEGFYYNSWLQLLTQTHHIIHFCQERANGCIWCISIKDDKRIKKVYSLSIRHCANTYGKVKLPDLQRSADLLSADGPCVVPPRSWDPEPAGICRVWKIASHKLSSILQHSPATRPLRIARRSGLVWLQLFCTFIRPLHGNIWQ